VKGEIVNMEQVTDLLESALHDAEKSADVSIDPRHVHVAVTGSHIVTCQGIGIAAIHGDDGKVTPEHVDAALRSAALIFLPPERPLRIRNEVESENVHVFAVTHPGPFAFDRDEIDEVRFWPPCELREGMADDGLFTPIFASSSPGCCRPLGLRHRSYTVRRSNGLAARGVSSRTTCV
jgi:hypothetical protein